MDKKTREAYVKAAAEAAKDTVETHAAAAYALETVFGFDLDVATDIYGAELLNPTEASIDILEAWKAFLEAGAEGRSTLVIVQQFSEPKPGCRGFGGDPGDEDHSRITFVKIGDNTTIDYNKGKVATDSTITLRDASTAVVGTTGEKGSYVAGSVQSPRDVTWQQQTILLAAPTPRPLFMLGDENWRFAAGTFGGIAPKPTIATPADHLEALRALNILEVKGMGLVIAVEAIGRLLEPQPRSDLES